MFQLQLQSIKILVVLSLSSVTVCNDANFLKCPLVWARTAKGDGIPANSVPTAIGGVIHFMARTEGTSEAFVAGRYEGGSVDASFIADGASSVLNPDSFEILTNPHGCLLVWQAGSLARGIHDVMTFENSGKYIGRGYIDGQQLGGSVQTTTASIVDKSGRVQRLTAGRFEVLKAYSKGLNLEVTNFIFDSDFFAGSSDFLGIDQIYNTADSHVKQIISHRKRVLQQTSISNSESWGHAFNVEFTIQPEFSVKQGVQDPIFNCTIGGGVTVSGPSLSLGYELDYTRNKSASFATSMESEVIVTREVNVPPFTSVHVCSTVNIKDNFALAYVAQGRYSSPGLTAQEVAAILAKDNKRGEERGDGIVVEERGVFKGTLALSTQFIVVDSEDPQGCSHIASKIAEAKRAMKSGILSQQEISAKNNEIRKMIYGKGHRKRVDC